MSGWTAGTGSLPVGSHHSLLVNTLFWASDPMILKLGALEKANAIRLEVAQPYLHQTYTYIYIYVAILE